MLVIALAKHHGTDAERERGLITRLVELPALVERTLELDALIQRLAERFADKHHALFLGAERCTPSPWRRAETQGDFLHSRGRLSAGELKHGPLALVDADMPW